MAMDHIQINSLMIDTLDPFPAWPRLCQASVGVGRTGTYWCRPLQRDPGLAVVKIGIRGIGRVLVEGREMLVKPGQVMLMRTGVDALEYGLHDGDEPWHAAYAELAGEMALAALGHLIQRHGHVYAPASGDLLEILTHLADRPGDHHALWDVGASSRAASTILSSIAHTRDSREGGVARKAIALFERNLTTPYTLEQAAAQLGISREQLGRSFRESLGIPPATWLRHRRLELARQLLMAPDAQVRLVAGQVGYRSVSQFLRAFTARYGQTPGVLRSA
jgi:AraC family transcriptional regulator, arabinose operon regulatory protein